MITDCMSKRRSENEEDDEGTKGGIEKTRRQECKEGKYMREKLTFRHRAS